jgi:hypothetical protein
LWFEQFALSYSCTPKEGAFSILSHESAFLARMSGALELIF